MCNCTLRGSIHVCMGGVVPCVKYILHIFVVMVGLRILPHVPYGIGTTYYVVKVVRPWNIWGYVRRKFVSVKCLTLHFSDRYVLRIRYTNTESKIRKVY